MMANSNPLNEADVNLPPQFTPPPTVMHATEDSLFTIDLDDYFTDPEGRQLTYTLSSFANWLSIDQTTGILFGTPTNDDVGGYEIYIVASDGVSGLGTPFTLVRVANTNDAPTDIVGVPRAVPEGSFSFYHVVSLMVVDPDIADPRTFSLVDDAGGRFIIDASSGTLRVGNGSLIDYEAAGSHTVRVKVIDSAGASIEKDFVIPVTDVAEAPYSLVLTVGGAVAENSTSGTSVAQLTGTDPDAGAVLRYSLTESASGRFAIDPVSGAVTVTANAGLNFESQSSHQIVARVTDETGRHLENAFTIAVTDVNEAPVLLNMVSGGTVAENSANGTVVAQLRGGDVDAGSVLTYSLIDNAEGRFAIDPATGVITVANSTLLDFETATSHTILASVTDAGGLSYSPYFTITVADLADNFITGTSRSNRLTGTDGGDFISGLGGRDYLFGGNGDDILVGGAGFDDLTGGAGHDTFRFTALSDSARGGSRDHILDFNQNALDTLNYDQIDLSLIDANTKLAGDQAFDYIGGAAFDKVAGQLRFENGVLAGDVNGDGRADFEIALTLMGDMLLDPTNFIL